MKTTQERNFKNLTINSQLKFTSTLRAKVANIV